MRSCSSHAVQHPVHQALHPALGCTRGGCSVHCTDACHCSAGHSGSGELQGRNRGLWQCGAEQLGQGAAPDHPLQAQGLGHPGGLVKATQIGQIGQVGKAIAWVRMCMCICMLLVSEIQASCWLEGPGQGHVSRGVRFKHLAHAVYWPAVNASINPSHLSSGGRGCQRRCYLCQPCSRHGQRARSPKPCHPSCLGAQPDACVLQLPKVHDLWQGRAVRRQGDLALSAPTQARPWCQMARLQAVEQQGRELHLFQPAWLSRRSAHHLSQLPSPSSQQHARTGAASDCDHVSMCTASLQASHTTCLYARSATCQMWGS